MKNTQKETRRHSIVVVFEKHIANYTYFLFLIFIYLRARNFFFKLMQLL